MNPITEFTARAGLRHIRTELRESVDHAERAAMTLEERLETCGWRYFIEGAVAAAGGGTFLPVSTYPSNHATGCPPAGLWLQVVASSLHVPNKGI